MIRASPCDYYLKYLCTHPDDYSDLQVRNLVKLQHLDFLGMEHLGRIRQSCIPPTPFYPEEIDHRPSQRFLTKERIFQLYHPDEDALCAIRLLDHPRGKELTESSLFSGIEPPWVCATLKRVQFQASSRAIELYRHYYFNTGLVDGTELRAIMGMRSYVAVDGQDADAVRYQANYERASKSEIAALASSSTLSPFSRIINMMKVGIMPSGLHIAKIASAGRMVATVRSLENSITGHAERARDFALTGKILNELMESVGDVSGDLQKSLMSMVLDTDASEVQSIESLTAGNHTMDLLPEPVKQEELAGVEADGDGDGDE